MDTADEDTVKMELVELQDEIQKLVRMRRALVAERSECVTFEDEGFLYLEQIFTRKYKI
ncbi:hypothetical protein DPMN_160624 [Dreissena polymorpha]|uniref:Uncharacterized protein n=1 Tax=Dreissena polymorpha TaxID=45954 RepID=A0A9D4IQB0_DREPO|nr:hypothetical protein DPMN_160624 [Dreissena polymorpha]